MIRLYDFDEVRPEEILNRDIRAEADVEATVDAIIADVRARGDAALIEYAAKFDHAELTDVRVSQVMPPRHLECDAKADRCNDGHHKMGKIMCPDRHHATPNPRAMIQPSTTPPAMLPAISRASSRRMEPDR